MNDQISVVSDAVPVDDREGDGRDVFECRICMQSPRNSVLTTCGHLFCWSCLYMWIRDEDKPCPLCKVTLTKARIIPVYCCQKESSIVESSIPIPSRPSAPAVSATAPTHRSARPEYYSESSPLPRPVRQRHLRSIGSRAYADFRAIRQLHPQSPTAWIAAASDRFNPIARSARDDGSRPTDEIQIFISHVLVPEGEYIPGIYDFRMSWLRYYEARIWGISPCRSALQHYDEFLQSWGMHFYEAWHRAGRPNNQASLVGAVFPEESQVNGTRHGTRHRRTSSEESDSIASPMEVEMEVDVERVYTTESRRIVSRRSVGEDHRGSRRLRPY